MTAPQSNGYVRTGWLLGVLVVILIGMSGALWAVVTSKADQRVVDQIDKRLDRIENKLDAVLQVRGR